MKREESKTVEIRIWGIVQGVGFRPFVAKIADHLGIKGEVLNMGGLVHIRLTDYESRIAEFIELLKEKKPLPAEIVHIRVEEQEQRAFEGFTILDSHYGDDEAGMIPADLSICPHCLAELEDEENPRYQHPFISCMACGPRYTIIDRFPYDRENTSMIDFSMCEFCHEEYTNRENRRYHAQTISCHDCGPMLIYESTKKKQEASAIGIIGGKASKKIQKKAMEPLLKASLEVLQGGIIALKSVGGYNLVSSPFMEDSVKTLRRIKMRDEKPFAIMFKNIEQVREYCHVGEEEEKLLQSSAKPIVLLEKKASNNSDGKKARLMSEEACKNSRYIGAFLPSMGVQHMLLDICGPLIMTSANLSNMPIIIEDQEIRSFVSGLGEVAGILYNERKIRIPLDDSVIRVIDKQPQMIRRSKGYAPVPLYIKNKLNKEHMILASGGQLKSSFALSKGPFSYISQYFGDLDSRESGIIYKDNVERMKALFRIEPSLVVSDLHPLYFTSGFGQSYSQKHGIESLLVQHHHAHVASVMAEHHLEGQVLGVSFDGTGYGADGAIWGGEFLLCQGRDYERSAHLEYVKMIGADSSMKEGWKSALSYLYQYKGKNHYEKSLSNLSIEEKNLQMVERALENNINTIKSSSMGRLFDAVAAITGIQGMNRYEGECAIMLENAAAEALEKGYEPYEMAFDIKGGSPIIISGKPILLRIEEGLLEGIKVESLALGFHQAVAEMILQTCLAVRDKKNVNQVALTGGVFQNKILMEETLNLLRACEFSVYYNISVGPNDGGICLGQNYLGMKYLEERM